MSLSSALALPARGGQVSPCGCLLADLQLAVPSQGNRCPNAASSPAALLGHGGSSRHVSPPGLLCVSLPCGDYVCFPSEEGHVQGQPEKEADDLLVPRCSSDGLQRVGRATPSLLSVQIDVAVPVCGRGEVRQYLFFTGQ